jgi:hypothetical protein
VGQGPFQADLAYRLGESDEAGKAPCSRQGPLFLAAQDALSGDSRRSDLDGGSTRSARQCL